MDGKIKGWSVKKFWRLRRGTSKVGRVNFHGGKRPLLSQLWTFGWERRVRSSPIAIPLGWIISLARSFFGMPDKWRRIVSSIRTGEWSGFMELRVVVYRVPVSPCHVEVEGTTIAHFSCRLFGTIFNISLLEISISSFNISGGRISMQMHLATK